MLNVIVEKLEAVVQGTQRVQTLTNVQTRLTVLWVGFMNGGGLPWILSMSNFQGLGNEINVTDGEPCLTVVPTKSEIMKGTFRMGWSYYNGSGATVLCHGDF